MTEPSYIAFKGNKCIADGNLLEVAMETKKQLDRDKNATYLVFEQQTSRPVDLDLRGSIEDVRVRMSPRSPPVGRPKLGVLSREITLLPRHWDWLATQSGGASIILRKLVETAMRSNQEKERLAQEATHKFMSAMAGDLPHYEEALRALYAKKSKDFNALTAKWPKDIREHVQKLSKASVYRD